MTKMKNVDLFILSNFYFVNFLENAYLSVYTFVARTSFLFLTFFFEIAIILINFLVA